jgi:hypothetical protein
LEGQKVSEDHNNITALDGGRKPDPLAAAVRAMRENLPALLEYIAIDAQFTRARFLALKKEGFTDAQAVELARKSLG